MENLMNILHVVSAVFIVGPMAILPMTAMRAIRAGNGVQVAGLAKSTNLLSLLSLIVVVFGFGAMSMADERFNLSVTTPWILWSIILYAVALGLSLFLVVPTMRRAAEALQGSGSTAPATPNRYPAIAAGSGTASLLLVIVVVLMVWKP
ncbi:MAG: conjugal transfer protein TrbL [Cryobacterium sp.]|nr:conjugal transfer protein TrbL [Cryobacterium sp.]